MSWKQQGGGPWGGGGDGQGGGGQQPPDIEEMLRRSQDHFKSFLPAGAGGGRGLILVIMAAFLIWLGSGFYRIQPGEQGVELLFGEFAKLTSPGLNYWPPSPLGEVIKVNAERTNTINIGFRGAVQDSSISGRDMPLESLMLTGDQNIIDIDFVVQWRIKNAADYLFNIRDPESTIKAAAESAIREVIGRTPLESALTRERQRVQDDTQLLLQEILDDYGAGVVVVSLQLQSADPPKEVIDAFNDVQRAKQDQERSINEATAYSNNIVPRAKGEAQKMIQEAEAYKEQVIKDAQGEAQRFLSVYESYKGAKEVTRLRLYLERMQGILQGSTKIILDQQGGGEGQGVVPYLPLNELMKGTAQ